MIPIGPLIGGVLGLLGKTGKGKATVTGVAATAIGLVGAQATVGNPFESVKVLIDLVQQGWPHLMVVVGAILTLFGVARKAGAALPKS